MALMGSKSVYSSSSSTTSAFKYDVFLSFRGDDTRKNFTGHLYAALKQKGIFTFRDDEKLERGTFITPELLRAIEESRFAVVVISQNYASSSWCLVELAKIVECMEKERLIVLPVFHYIDPSDVRNLRKTFGEAFAKHEECYQDNIEEVHRWKAALTKVASIAGWDLRDKHEANVVEEIVRKISNKLISTYSIVHKDFVGINSRMEELVNLLGMGLNGVRFIGIWGMGGLGKTTLARVVYDRFRYYFDGSSFLANVREECGKHGLVHLQKQLLFDILIERNIDFSDVQWGCNVIKKRLCYKSVLIVLDDVDQLDQLEALAGERVWFGQGSRVIITTRDQHLLIKHDVARAEIYKAKELNSDEALRLFSRKAFKKDHPLEGYVELSKKAICYAQGLPLALNVLGPLLKGRSLSAWESALDRLEETPPKKVLDTLRISFDSLEETEKKIFLDIACFFKGEHKNRVTNILQTPRYKPSIDIDVLMEKSLITIFGGRLWMHDLLQELGRQIVHSESPEQPGSRSRLWLKDDVLHVLKNNTGSKKIRGIMLHSPQQVKVQLHTEAFKKMKNLKFFIVENVHICKPLEFLPHSLKFFKWTNYPFHWPFKYFPEQLVALEMPHSRIRLPKLIKQERRLVNLIAVNLRGCEFITKLPKLWAPNLEDLDLSSCRNLVEIDEYFGSHGKLKFWNLNYCKNLQILPSQLRLKSLVSFHLWGCSRLEKLPDFHPEMECLETLNLVNSGIREVPSSIEHLTKLNGLYLPFCKNLRDLPDSIYKLQQLQELQTHTAKLRPTCNYFDGSFGYGFVNMTKFDLCFHAGIIELDLLMKPDYFPALEMINLCGTNIVTIPESISRFPRLTDLDVHNCKLLREIQGLPQSIKQVNVEGCMLLDTQSPSGLLNQVIEMIGILPSRVCGRARSNKLMDPQLTNYFPSETEGAESEDGDISMDPQFSNHFPSETEVAKSEDGDISESEDGDISESEDEYEDYDTSHEITFWGTEMPKWVNHQSVDNSIFFFVGRKFPKLVVCIVARECFDGEDDFDGTVDISINGYRNRKKIYYFCADNALFLFSRTQQSLQRLLNESNPTDQNLVEVSITSDTFSSIKRWGVHVECTCPPQESANAPIWYSIKRLGVQVDDVVEYLPTSKKQRTR
ncbi:disease resistance protein Roq1-like [Castanea sativa]|uniref:disease resistance protein Roq1-like n=1 Tax=Castanea sativa TaxID=21020 RepID=UPI003F652E83